jgi:hypothetical protein
MSNGVMNVGECIAKYLENLKILLPEVKETKEKKESRRRRRRRTMNSNLFQIHRIKMK